MVSVWVRVSFRVSDSVTVKAKVSKVLGLV